jgi:inner membrane protein
MSNPIIPGSWGLLLKTLLTGFLILVMIIPSVYVMNLVDERKDRQQEVIKEVSSKWAGDQVVAGPFLVVPYSYPVSMGNGQTETIVKQLVVLPDSLSVTGSINPQVKKRGIYKVALYQSSLKLAGHFSLERIKADAGETINWADARLCMGVSDTRGIVAQVQGSWLGQPLTLDAGLPDNELAANGMSIPVNLEGQLATPQLAFDLPLELRGSEALQVLPLGKTTNVALQSPWPSPSFTGKFLPQHSIDNKGFTASWQVLHFNRSFPQVWKAQKYDAKDYAFGVSLLQTTDNYAKTNRSTKYAIMFIGLMFGFFFLLEVLLGRKVHPVQYILVGIALLVFYTLLLSIGEILTFNTAYLLASAATVVLITTYAKHLFGTLRNAGIIGGFLGGLYLFMFVLIQLEDTALLAGSIGLFLLVALAMHFSKKINWYGEQKPDQNIIEQG